MAIVKRTDSIGRKYYYNTTTSTRTTEEAYNRSKSSANSAKTQFKSAKGYACAKAGSVLGKKVGTKKTPSATKAGRVLRTCEKKR